MKKISLILPVYNVEQYLVKCIISCLNQDIPKSEYEIIIVIDGSTDNSLKIAQEFQTENDNITIIEQENKGLSGARNTGLRAATGEYVWFIDSDDWIEDNCLDGILSLAYKEDLECIYLNNVNLFENEEKKEYKLCTLPSGDIYNGETLFAKHASGSPVVWLFVVRKNILISNLLFNHPGILHEDVEFTPRLLYYINKLAIFPGYPYYHMIRQGSIMTTISNRKLESFHIIINNLIEFNNEKVESRSYKVLLTQYVLGLASGYFHLRKSFKNNNAVDIAQLSHALRQLKFVRGLNMKNIIKYYVLTKMLGLYKYFH